MTMIPGVQRTGNLALLYIFIVLMALPRVAGVTDEFYQAMSHLFVGGMIGAAWGRGVHASLKGSDYGWGAFWLTMVEVTMFIITHL
jgi:hypothetical protein